MHTLWLFIASVFAMIISCVRYPGERVWLFFGVSIVMSNVINYSGSVWPHAGILQDQDAHEEVDCSCDYAFHRSCIGELMDSVSARCKSAEDSTQGCSPVSCLQTWCKKKECIVLREIHLRTTGRHLSMGSQCYLPPDRGDRPAFTPTGQVGTRCIDPVRMKGWVGLVCWLHTEMVYPSTDGHPSEY